MNGSLIHPTPGRLYSDEEKFFRFFSKRNLIAIIIACIPGLALLSVFTAIGLKSVGVILLCLFIAGAYILTTVTLPAETRPYSGGGLLLLTIIVRRLFRKFTKTTYIKNYDLLRTKEEE